MLEWLHCSPVCYHLLHPSLYFNGHKITFACSASRWTFLWTFPWTFMWKKSSYEASHEPSHESHYHLKVHMKIQMKLFLHMKVHVKVQKSLHVKVHSGWAPKPKKWLLIFVMTLRHKTHNILWTNRGTSKTPVGESGRLLIPHMCYIQCTVGGDWVVENLHWKSDFTTSNYKTVVVSATGVLATNKRSQNVRTDTIILTYKKTKLNRNSLRKLQKK